MSIDTFSEFSDQISNLQGVTPEDISNIEDIFNTLVDSDDMISIEVINKSSLWKCISNPKLDIAKFHLIAIEKYDKFRQDIQMDKFSKFCDILRSNLVLIKIISSSKISLSSLEPYIKRLSKFNMSLLDYQDNSSFMNYKYSLDFIKNKEEIENICNKTEFLFNKT